MLEVASEKLTGREQECLEHFRRAQEQGMRFAEYCRSQNLKANEWHAVDSATSFALFLAVAPIRLSSYSQTVARSDRPQAGQK